jgi:ketosteroid isomerase-like protein
MSDSAHRELCHELFDAIEQSDVARVADCYAPDMTMWFNGTGTEHTRAENLATLEAGYGLHRRRTYDDRRISTFDDGFLVQYTLNVIAHDGSKHTLWACLVAEVRDGLITKLYEYLDTGKFARRPRSA